MVVEDHKGDVEAAEKAARDKYSQTKKPEDREAWTEAIAALEYDNKNFPDGIPNECKILYAEKEAAKQEFDSIHEIELYLISEEKEAAARLKRTNESLQKCVENTSSPAQ